MCWTWTGSGNVNGGVEEILVGKLLDVLERSRSLPPGLQDKASWRPQEELEEGDLLEAIEGKAFKNM